MHTFFPIQIIAGLGNPGKEYECTRHNAGFILLNELAQIYAGRWQIDKNYHAELCKISLANTSVWLIKPQTFMNRSGHSVVPFMRFHRFVPESLLVVHDELDLLPGEVRVKQGGGNGGHNGLKDIQAQLGSANFWRMRLGIGHPRSLQLQQGVADFVLTRPIKSHYDAMAVAQNQCIKHLPILIHGHHLVQDNFQGNKNSDEELKHSKNSFFDNSIKELHILKSTLSL
ncbi:MAG: peptidyl-tRNA hydrolase [Pseudomonadota bacterium]|jgi:PTH1 family peptidyl-tRNA hydrolase